MKRVSEVVTIDKVKSWNPGDIITIEAGTGMGKSYFIKNNLYALAKKNDKRILMLVHRNNCYKQFKMEIEADNKKSTIQILTYQSLENIYKNGGTFNFSSYQYIVCDEFHYFMSDASFNKTTDISLNALLSLENNIRIFMSATGDYMKKYINNHRKMESIDYQLPITFDFIDTLSFYNKDSSLNGFIENVIKNDTKAIFFIQSAEKAYKLFKRFEEYCLFNCSKYNKDNYYKFVNADKINKMLVDEKFEENILITTTCLDAGVNIIDEKLTHIVCDVKDTGTLIQCIGRKRQINKDDKIQLAVKSVSNQSLGGMQTNITQKLTMARYLRTHTVKEYIEKYSRDADKWNIVYDDVINGETDIGTKKVNELMYFKSITDANLMDEMKSFGSFGFNKYLADKLGFYNKDYDTYEYTVLEEEGKKVDLESYLESIVNKRLYKEDQKDLITKIDLRVDRKLQRSYKKLNEGIEMIKLPYIIVKDLDRRRVLDDKTINLNRDKTYWMVVRCLG